MSLEVAIKKQFSSFALEVDFSTGDETLGFLGASGCGKSLTMRCIAGIETPDEGKIVVNGTTFFDKASQGKARVNLTPQQRKTALLFQNYMLFPNPARPKRCNSAFTQASTSDLLRFLSTPAATFCATVRFGKSI